MHVRVGRVCDRFRSGVRVELRYCVVHRLIEELDLDEIVACCRVSFELTCSNFF